MQRRTTTQDLSWLVDHYRSGQLDLDPPYQRRSVWTRSDQQFFLDTIFRNYPSPAIYLHKTIATDGTPTYHVVDGKQRTQAILDFINDHLKIPQNYGDNRLSGKTWSQLQSEQQLTNGFWNYEITVEMIDVGDGRSINEVFDRLNRNARNLTRQELRHARYDGWLISRAEDESNRRAWRDLGIVTRARSKRMLDVQFFSELMLVILETKIVGFNQNTLDRLYVKYETPEEIIPVPNLDHFENEFSNNRRYLLKMNSDGHVSN